MENKADAGNHGVGFAGSRACTDKDVLFNRCVFNKVLVAIEQTVLADLSQESFRAGLI